MNRGFFSIGQFFVVQLIRSYTELLRKNLLIWRIGKSIRLYSNLNIFQLLVIIVSMPVAEASEAVNAHFLQIELPGENRILTLAEVEVYSGSKLISQQSNAEQVSTFSKAVALNAIDGNTSGNYYAKTMAATSKGSFVWWKLDFGANFAVSKIKIYNRTDCCSERINPARIILLNREKEIVWEGEISSTKSEYEFTVKKLTTRQLKSGRNLLRNAAFSQQTNPLIPDYWDLHHAAALKFETLHKQYEVVRSIKSPVVGTQVLKIVNSEKDFTFATLIPRNLYMKLPKGNYIFSVYVKSKRNKSVLKVSQGWDVGEMNSRNVSKNWQRYSFDFYYSGADIDMLQPILYFPSDTTYFIAAPQLELGTVPSEFQISYFDSETKSTVSSSDEKVVQLQYSKKLKIEGEKNNLISTFEYSYYTDEQYARLSIKSNYLTKLDVHIKCNNAYLGGEGLYKSDNAIRMLPHNSITVDIPLAKFPIGTYKCDIDAFDGDVKRASNTVKLTKILSNPVEVRINNNKRTIIVNDKPFYIVGVAVSVGAIVPNWYFREIKQNGFNTLFYNVAFDNDGEFNLESVRSLLVSAAIHHLKVVIGLPIAGTKPKDWRKRTSRFSKLVNSLKNYIAIIGWYVVDEPAANTWKDEELIEVYEHIKKIDPYRIALVNWAYDGVPKYIGEQPRGTLGATDMYSIDYYPFAGLNQSMNGYTNTTIRALETARKYNKASHSWLQLFGSFIAWREPTGTELKYMAYLNLVYGSMISYWDTKSNSADTWKQVSIINRQANELAKMLFLHKDAYELIPPILDNNFIYSVWKNGKNIYVIVVNTSSETEDFTCNISKIVINDVIVEVQSVFERRNITVLDENIKDKFQPFGTGVYRITTR